MPRSSASRGLAIASRLAAPDEIAGVGADDAGEDLEQRGLAGAVLADEGVRLALRDRERHAPERAHGAERLLDVAELETGHGWSLVRILLRTLRVRRRSNRLQWREMSRLWTRIAALATLWLALSAVAGAQPAEAPSLRTRWAADVTSHRVLPEHPRPDLMRGRWTNLNGPWDFAITSRDATPPAAFAGRILVPFPIESQLSGVRQRDLRRAACVVPPHLRGPAPARRRERLLLHFGAVDWEATVCVNGRHVGTHRGGYDPFTFDITDALRAARASRSSSSRSGTPPTRGPQPRGKQVLKPQRHLVHGGHRHLADRLARAGAAPRTSSDLVMTPDVDAGDA